MRLATTILILFALLTFDSSAQTKDPQSFDELSHLGVDRLAETFLAQPTLRPLFAAALADRKELAVSALEMAFDATAQESEREQIGVMLSTAGFTSEPVRAFFMSRAQSVVELDKPFPFEIDDSGEMVRERLAPEFVDWCSSRQLSVKDAIAGAVYLEPAVIMILGRLRDPAYSPLLIEALDARNFFVVNVAALALGYLQADEAVPEIISRCERLPRGFAQLAAWPLAMFASDEAQRAAVRFIPDANLRRHLQAEGMRLRATPE